MSIDAHVTSLALSRRLKELGCKQESSFYWIKINNITSEHIVIMISGDNYDKYYVESAYLLTELLEMLPQEINGYFYTQMPTLNPKNGWVIFYRNAFNTWKDSEGNEITTHGNNIVNVAAEMLIYLIEQGIVKP